MTVADVVRRSSDYQLACLFAGIVSAQNEEIFKQITAQGVKAELVEVPSEAIQRQLDFLSMPASVLFEVSKDA